VDTPTPGGAVGAGTVTPAGTVVSGVPSTGTGPGDGGSSAWWPLLLVVPVVAAGFGVFAMRHARR
jgi:hypothetical protein